MSELKNKDEQYSELLNYNKMSSERKNRILFFIRAIFVTIFVIFVTIFVMNIITNYDSLPAFIDSIKNKNFSGLQGGLTDINSAKFNFKMLSRYQNILLLGVDSNGPNTLPFSGVRSDSIIVVSIDNQKKSVNAISIPRDSKVYVSDGHGVQKINSAYALGGIDLTKKTIEETFGIKIHNYIVVNSEGIKKLIDAIGGVPVYIDQNMNYDDYSAKLHIHFNKGEHVLNGEESEKYLRYRKDFLGDIGRVHRQQKFMSALIEKLKNPQTLKKIPELIKIVNLYSRTDLNLYQMSQYASMAKDLDLNKSEFVMMPGAPNKRGIISYWILDPEKTQQVINRLIYRKDDNLNNMTFGIMYSASMEPFALALKEELKLAGYNINCIGKSSKLNKSGIIRYNSSITDDMIKSLKQKVSALSKYKYEHSVVRVFCDTSDILITMNGDSE